MKRNLVKTIDEMLEILPEYSNFRVELKKIRLSAIYSDPECRDILWEECIYSYKQHFRCIPNTEEWSHIAFKIGDALGLPFGLIEEVE
jgi:hypothetical protein